MPIFHTPVSTAMDISGNLLMLLCYVFLHKCNVKKMMTMYVEASCKMVVFTEWRIYIKCRASTSISLFENIENWLGGYKRWLCSVLNCKKCARMNCWLPPEYILDTVKQFFFLFIWKIFNLSNYLIRYTKR